MIFVTVGTQDVPFDRLLKAVDKCINDGVITEEVIVQCGNTKYKSKNMKMVNLLPIDEFKNIISSARVIIAHGGVGTITDAINSGKPVIATPRLRRYKEAVNDHQLQIIKQFEKMGFIIPLYDLKKLEDALVEAKKFKCKKYKSNTNNMVKLIENYIDNN